MLSQQKAVSLFIAQKKLNQLGRLEFENQQEQELFEQVYKIAKEKNQEMLNVVLKGCPGAINIKDKTKLFTPCGLLALQEDMEGFSFLIQNGASPNYALLGHAVRGNHAEGNHALMGYAYGGHSDKIVSAGFLGFDRGSVPSIAAGYVKGGFFENEKIALETLVSLQNSKMPMRAGQFAVIRREVAESVSTFNSVNFNVLNLLPKVEKIVELMEAGLSYINAKYQANFLFKQKALVESTEKYYRNSGYFGFFCDSRAVKLKERYEEAISKEELFQIRQEIDGALALGKAAGMEEDAFHDLINQQSSAFNPSKKYGR